MKTQLLATLGASALLLGGIGMASAANHDAANAKAAAADAGKADRALALHQAPAAIASAEAAVALASHDADYRLLLGRSYLAAGRFASARGAFADAVTLSPDNAKAALDLALMQIATGDWAGARHTLDDHSASIALADRGLATALAGDPAAAVAMLSQAARSPDATPKVRQNLALSLALSGQWQAARTVAAVDVAPADLDTRMEQWASFARPTGAADQVATLLGVTPVADGGMPVALALGGGAPSIQVAATTAPAAVAQAAVVPSPAVAVATPHEQPQAAAIAVTAGTAPAQVSFAAAHEVVQALPPSRQMTPRPAVIAADHVPMKVALGAPVAPVRGPAAKGGFFVQLGAFQSAAVARDAWGRATHRLPALATSGASGMNFSAKGTNYYRLSVGGFARGDADALCRRYRQAGGACFVRAGAGDQIASWTKKTVQVASR